MERSGSQIFQSLRGTRQYKLGRLEKQTEHLGRTEFETIQVIRIAAVCNPGYYLVQAEHEDNCLLRLHDATSQNTAFMLATVRT
jgi:hypothetical protein